MAGFEILTQSFEPRLHRVRGKRGEGRTGGADNRVEVHLGSAPKCRLEAVREVVRYLEGRHGMRAQGRHDVRHVREAGGFHGTDGGDVVRHDPQSGPMFGIPGEDNLTTADPTELGEPPIEIVPVMHGHDGHRHVEGRVAETADVRPWPGLAEAPDAGPASPTTVQRRRRHGLEARRTPCLRRRSRLSRHRRWPGGSSRPGGGRACGGRRSPRRSGHRPAIPSASVHSVPSEPRRSFSPARTGCGAPRCSRRDRGRSPRGGAPSDSTAAPRRRSPPRVWLVRSARRNWPGPRLRTTA